MTRKLKLAQNDSKQIRSEVLEIGDCKGQLHWLVGVRAVSWWRLMCVFRASLGF